jgi:hypothetical protein
MKSKRIPALAVLILLSALSCLATTPANAGAYVDRSFGMTRPQQGSPASALSLFPPGTLRTPVVPAPDAPPDSDSDQHGSYSVDVMSATIYSKNIVYITPLPLPPHLNARVTISNVMWKYSTKTQPSGFEAALCWKNNKTCINVTRYGSGQSGDFNGRDALQPFLLQYQVVGSGKLIPVVGEAAQIIVTYRIWPQ